MAKQIETLVAKLQKAAHAYYETDTPIMTDTEYDACVETLQKLSPNHPFLASIGSQPTSGATALPVPMPSLDKRKPDTYRPETLGSGPFICSDKLDGISALWVCGFQGPSKLYLRGNGTLGQDVTHCSSGIKGLVQTSLPICIVRGECIVPRSESIARNWVNGVFHQLTPSKEDLQKIQFVAYQVCTPSTLTRSQQMTWLINQGFQVPWYMQFPSTPTVEHLSTLFQTRRSDSPYECDGLVIGRDCIPILSTSNPKDAFAFKMPVDDQRAETIVEDVEWASSRTGNWIPRIRFQPVQIGGATIQYATGFHAEFVSKQGIGPGAKVLIRRSGDVIPTIETVLQPAPQGWKTPPEGCWKWDDNHVHAIDCTPVATPEKLALELTHQLVSFGVEGISQTTAKKLVVAGFQTLQTLRSATVTQLQDAIGSANGAKLHSQLTQVLRSAPEATWVRAFLGWPKGFGETRIQATLACEPSVAKWPTLVKSPKGQSATAFAEVQAAVPAYLKWRSLFADCTPVVASTPTTASTGPSKGSFVMSGFRDPVLQARLSESGWEQEARVTKKTTVLLIADDVENTTKVQAARKAGIRIVLRSEVEGLF